MTRHRRGSERAAAGPRTLPRLGSPQQHPRPCRRARTSPREGRGNRGLTTLHPSPPGFLLHTKATLPAFRSTGRNRSRPSSPETPPAPRLSPASQPPDLPSPRPRALPAPALTDAEQRGPEGEAEPRVEQGEPRHGGGGGGTGRRGGS